MSVIRLALDSVKRVARAIGNLFPSPPSSSDSPPPDIDGRRQSQLDPAALQRIELARKEGRGGFR